MPIVSSSFTETPQADGSNNVTVVFLDNAGVTYTQQWNAAAGTNIQSVIDIHAAALSQQLADAEFEALIGG